MGMVQGAHGHGIGAEESQPLDLGGRQVFIQVNAVSVAGSEIDQQFTFKLMNAEDGKPVSGVTYQITASKQGVTLFDEEFESGSGTLVIDLVHSEGGGIEVEKRASGIFGFISGDTDLARVTGPYFDYGGLYQFNIRILAADSFSNSLSPPPEWDAGISIADTTFHAVDDANFGEQTLAHISYYDVIEDFGYDPASRSISFEMPFDASPDSINQTSIVHEEVSFPKSFGDLMISEITATVNGVEMPTEAIQIDDFTENIRIVHLTLSRNNILELYEAGRIPEDRLSFVMGPSGPDLPYSVVTRNGQFRIIMEPVPADPASGEEVEIRYRLVDVFLKDRPVKVDYSMYVVQEGAVLFSTGGTSSDEAGRFESARFPVPDDVTGIVYVHFENLAGNSLASAKLPIVVDRTVPGQPDGALQAIPGWIRSNAGWWAEGVISDDEFVRGMEFLIGSGVIRV